ncbi:MAG: hypothetical protein J6A21_09100, partial [Lentisphaeria bacterium]|nr:hypothetical protein [Lentisphaeria bacterium]
FFFLLFCLSSGFLSPLCAEQGKASPSLSPSPGKEGKSAVPQPPAPPPPASPEKKSGKEEEKKSAPKPTEQQKFFATLSLVLDSVRRSSPRTGKVLDEKLRNDPFSLIRNFLQGSGTGIVCVTVSPGAGKIGATRRKGVSGGRKFSSENLYGGKILYIFLPDLSAKSCEKCLEALNELPGTLAGIVLDLRKCSSYGTGHIPPLLRKFREIVERKEGGKTGPLRLAVLTGNGTKGAGELLSFRLKSFPNVLLAGTPTFGQPFLLRPLPLTLTHTPPAKQGAVPGEKKVMRILVPVIPAGWENVPPAAVRPQIKTKDFPLYGEENNVSPDKDPSLRIASDLILSMEVTGTRLP